MSKRGNRGWNLTGANKPPQPTGEASPSWKGDAASKTTKRRRAQKAYPLADCERCGEPATDGHHNDGDTGNNIPSNIEKLCRRCHMAADGRLEKFLNAGAQHRAVEQPAKPCLNCKRLAKPLRKGRCHACNEYLRRRGVERPYVDSPTGGTR